MKTIYLARHAKSSWDLEGVRDIDRPLKERGIRDAYVMGSLLKQRGIVPDAILCSSATRAFHTAVIIMRQLEYPRERFNLKPLIYETGATSIIRMVQQQDDALHSLMLFGHNPTFTSLANALGSANIENLPTCGIAGIEFNTNTWQEVDGGKGKLTFYEIPKNHR